MSEARPAVYMYRLFMRLLLVLVLLQHPGYCEQCCKENWWCVYFFLWVSQVALVVPANAGDIRDVGAVPGFGRSPGGGHGSPLQYLAWRTPWTEEPGGPQSMGSQRVGHDCRD